MRSRAPSEFTHHSVAPTSRRSTGRSRLSKRNEVAHSPELWSPYDTISTWRIRQSPVDPSTSAYRVRGLATPFATYTTRPPSMTSMPEHPWASPFEGFPSTRSVLLSEPLPSGRFHPPPRFPRESIRRDAQLQGFVPVPSPFHQSPEGARRPIPSWGSTSPEHSPA